MRRLLLATASVGLSLIVLWMIWNVEQRTIAARFERDTTDIGASLERQVSVNLRALEAVVALYAASVQVTREEFRTFVLHLAQHNPSLQALSWNPYVPAQARGLYEERARQEGLPNFQITERDATGRLVPAASRPLYTPVYLIEPYQGNEAALGFDLRAEPMRLQTLTRMEASGQVTATPPITLEQERGTQKGVILFWPIYGDGQRLVACASGVFRIGDLMETALQDLEPRGIDLYLFDESAPAGAQLLHAHPARPRPGLVNPAVRRADLQRGLWNAKRLAMPGRSWRLLCQASPAYLAANRTWQPWGLLGAGVALAGLLVVYLSQRQRAEAALRIAYTRLKETQAQLVQAEKLGAIGRLASGIAHEVKNPLAILQQGVSYLRPSAPALGAEQVTVLRAMENAVARADAIIQGLLKFSRPAPLKLVPVNLNDVIKSSLILVEKQVALQGISIVQELAQTLPCVAADPNQLQQVLLNLITNAAQAMPGGGRLTLRTAFERLTQPSDGIGRRATDVFRPGQAVVICEVQDTGGGIPTAHLQKIGEPFFTTRPPGEGTGLGLSIICSIIDAHRGLLSVDSEVGRGTTMRCLLPVAAQRLEGGEGHDEAAHPAGG